MGYRGEVKIYPILLCQTSFILQASRMHLAQSITPDNLQRSHHPSPRVRVHRRIKIPSCRAGALREIAARSLKDALCSPCCKLLRRCSLCCTVQTRHMYRGMRYRGAPSSQTHTAACGIWGSLGKPDHSRDLRGRHLQRKMHDV
jgi:hypothetical protein